MVGLTVILSIVLIALLSYWTWYPYKTVTYDKGLFKTDKIVYKQGEIAHYHVDYCKDTDIKPTVRRFYVDGLKIEASENSSDFTKGCRNQEISFLIPKTLPPGRWQLEIEATYKFNPVRAPLVRTAHTMWFYVERANTGAYGDNIETNNQIETTLFDATICKPCLRYDVIVD